jgi:sugar phosphate isomerase/epimerase
MPRPAVIKSVVTDLEDTLEATIGRIAEHSYEGVECGLNDDPAEMTALLNQFDLETTSIMTGLHHVREPTDELLEAAETLRTDRAVLGWLDETYYENPETTRETAHLLNECADALADHGLELLYHNHDHEFASFGDRTAMDVLVDELDDDVQFEVDVGWVGVGGADPVAFIAEHGDRIPLIHLKDMDYETGQSLPLGEGDLDAEGVVRAARGADVDWLIYEHEQPEDKGATLELGACRMVELLERTRGGAD